MKNRDQIDLAAWEFFWKRTKKEVNDEGTRPDMIIGYREGYEQAIRDMENQDPGWSDPMADYLAEEIARYKDVKTVVVNRKDFKKKVREEFEHDRDLIKKILSDPRNADGFSDDSHRYPKYQYDGYTYILNDELTRIMSVSFERDASRWNLEESLKERDKAARKFKLDDSFREKLEEPTSWCSKHQMPSNRDRLCPKCLEENNK